MKLIFSFLVVTSLLAVSCVHKSVQPTFSFDRTYNTGIRGLYTVIGNEHFYDTTIDTTFSVSGNCMITVIENTTIVVHNDATLSSSYPIDTLHYISSANSNKTTVYATDSNAQQADTIFYTRDTRSAVQHIYWHSGVNSYDIRSTLTLN